MDELIDGVLGDAEDVPSSSSQSVKKVRPHQHSSTDDESWLVNQATDTAMVVHSMYQFHAGAHDPIALMGILGSMDNTFFNDTRRGHSEAYFFDRMLDIFS